MCYEHQKKKNNLVFTNITVNIKKNGLSHKNSFILEKNQIRVVKKIFR